MRVVCAPLACRVRALNTLQPLLAHQRSVTDAIKTLWKRRVDAVGTLCSGYNSATTGVLNVVQILWNRPMVCQGLSLVYVNILCDRRDVTS